MLSALGGWFGPRVDTARAGVFGHSRGTLSALAAVGGSAASAAGVPCGTDPARCWPLTADPRFQAAMGLAIGQQPISLGVNYQAIRVPTLLVSGSRDLMSPPSVSLRALNDQTANPDKRLVSVDNATHRSFDSNYCDEMAAAGRIAQADPSRAVLDQHTFDRIVTSPNSGWGTDYCTFASFAGIEALTRTATTSPALPNGFTPTATNVPASGLDTDAVKEQMAAHGDRVLPREARAGEQRHRRRHGARDAGAHARWPRLPGRVRARRGPHLRREHHRDGDLDGRLGDALDRRSRCEPGAAGQRHDRPRRGSAGARGHRGVRGAERQPR